MIESIELDSRVNSRTLANAANFAALTPLQFLVRSATVYPDKLAVIYGSRKFTYTQFYNRCRRLASALRQRGIGSGDTVAVLAPNIPPLLEAHYGVPMAGAVLNAINYHLDGRSIGFILAHGAAKLFIVDREFKAKAEAALEELGKPIPLVEIDDGVGGEALGGTEYEAFLGEGDPATVWELPTDEWASIALNYTSGTTGNPKGVVYHHRGAYLSALANSITFGLGRSSVYLWTLPMFHCNGWSFTWAVTVVAGTHICLRRIDPVTVFSLIAEHRVTHLCGAPIVLNLLLHAPEQAKRRLDHIIEIATGGASPPSAIIEGMERMGFRVTHLYGLTESYGPSAVCAWQEEWADLDVARRAGKMARQGVANLCVTALRVANPDTMEDVPADGTTIGELMLRSNTLMKGYLKDPTATEEVFAGGWFHTGDLAVMHADGYAEIKDRSKDIIICGAEKISSIEVEEVLYRHPRVMEAAVVSKPDPLWGEIPCAFVTLKPGKAQVLPEDIIAWCREYLPLFKVPRILVFNDLPKTATGKIRKFELRERAKHVTDDAEHRAEGHQIEAGSLELELTTICERLLGTPVSRSKNLIDQGADSLALLNIFLEISKRTKIDLPFGDLFQTPTIEGIANFIRRTGVEGYHPRAHNRASPDIRPATEGDIEAVSQFLDQQFTVGDKSPGIWRGLFAYDWLEDRPDLGLVLTAGDRIVGFLGAIYSHRQIGDKRGLICNQTSWSVTPEYRGWGVELLATAVKRNDITFTALTPSPAVVPMLKAVGFSELERRKMVFPSFLRAGRLGNQRLHIFSEPGTVRGSLVDEHKKIFDHHTAYACVQFFIEVDSEYVFLIVKRRPWMNTRFIRFFYKYMGQAYSDVLYCSNPPLFSRHLELIKQGILRQQKTNLLVCDERIFEKPPSGLSLRAPALYRSTIFQPKELDSLYSELILLPI